ncbi:MAG: 3-phosphoserine/phosphohydroxythreonine transaminase [Candidatus Melainabacteria bacterium HGW-Melainabacteria-1]|nr:MAG: 3-phosphoserine/phosphohydroxythreonine transaminase [Candidatus Melainabacteria bacterium HGW-Melainabacteria-1]
MPERIYNFSAGPAILPPEVIAQIQRELPALPGVGMSVLEISHRSKHFERILAETKQALSELLQLPPGYQILFLQGGASLQFSMIPINFLGGGKRAGYLQSGSWAEKALAEARREGEVLTVWSGKSENYARMPADSELNPSPDLAYWHMTSNETIQGIAFGQDPKCQGLPLICDASSDLLSRPLNVENYAMIYAGAQKNIGPAGVTVVILREDFLQTRREGLHTMLDYGTFAESDSLYNTPPVFAIYSVGLVARWLQQLGGLEAMYTRNRAKSELLYHQIDHSQGFYRGHAQPGSRSLMNVTFRLPTPELESQFLLEAQALGFDGLKGHRSVGGVRASIYNAFPLEGVEALVAFMQSFYLNHQ